MVHLPPVAPFPQVAILVELDAVQDGSGGDSGLLELLRKLDMAVPDGPGAQPSVEFIAMAQARSGAGESCVARPLGMARDFAQRLPLGIVADRDCYPFVIALALIGIMRRHRRVVVSPLPAIAAVHEIIHEPFMHLPDHGFAHAGVDPLSLARAIAMTQ